MFCQNHFDNIFQAARYGTASDVGNYIQKGVSINVKDENGVSPLSWAISPYRRTSLSEIVEFLIAHGADVNAQDNNGLTPLHRSALLGSRSITQVLLNSGAKQDFPSAVLMEDMKFIERFIEYTACVDDKVGDYTPLQWVAYRSDLPRALVLLIEKGANVNFQDCSDKRTPLHLASISGNQRSIAHLISAGGNPNLYDQNNKTPLHYAAEKNDLQLVKILAELGSDLKLRSGIWGFTALHFTSSLEVSKYLRSRGLQEKMYPISQIIFFVWNLYQNLLSYGF